MSTSVEIPPSLSFLPPAAVCCSRPACPVCLVACWELSCRVGGGEKPLRESEQRGGGRVDVWVSNWKPPPKERRLLTIQTDFQALRTCCWHYFCRKDPKLARLFFSSSSVVSAVLSRRADCSDSWEDSLVGAGLRIGPAVYPPLILREEEQWSDKRFLLSPSPAADLNPAKESKKKISPLLPLAFIFLVLFGMRR